MCGGGLGVVFCRLRGIDSRRRSLAELTLRYEVKYLGEEYKG